MGQTLQTDIVINARANESSFGNVQAQLQSMVNYAQQLSAKIIEFGKESADTYGEFEWNMQSARAYMQNNVSNTENIGRVMENLYTQAVKWADTTLFTTTDISGAILSAAQAGWSYQEMLDGIPAAMLLAQAGGLDLSQALKYVITAANSTQTPFKNLGQLVDQWVVAASNGTTSIEGLGQAMQRMGATSQFAADTAELMTMLTLLSQYGYSGSDAGTLLRNTMIRLIAPTKTASQQLQELGFTADEVEEALGDDSDVLTEQMQLLEQYGFSAYDASGNLKSMYQIFAELSASLQQMNEEERNGVLKSLFGTRSISGAMSLMTALQNGWLGVYLAVKGADGAAQNASDTMMDTQRADLELLNAHFETLKLLVGKELTEQIRTFANSIGDFISGINNMPEDQFSALVTGLETMAGLGAGLGLAAGAIKIFSSLGIAGGIGMTTLAIVSLATALQDLEEWDYNNLFGNMTADEGSITAYLATLNGSFDTAMTSVKGFNDQLNNIQTSYETASSALSSILLTKMLTGAELSQEDKETLFGLGDQMYGELVNGIQTGTNAQKSFWKYLFGESGEEGYEEVEGVINQGHAEAMAQAEALGADLRSAMTAAFEDNELTQDEYNNILEYVRNYNAAVARATAQAQAEQDLIDAQVALAKNQNLSLEGLVSASGLVTGKRDSGLDSLETEYLTNYFRLQNGGADAATLAAAQAAYNATRTQYSQSYDDILMKLWSQAIMGSDMSEGYTQLMNAANGVLAGGSGADALNAVARIANGEQLYRYMNSYVEALGGVASVQERIKEYAQNGNTDMVNSLSQILMMAQIMQGSNNYRDLSTLNMYTTKIDEMGATLGISETIAAQQAYADAHPIVIQTVVAGVGGSQLSYGTGSTGGGGAFMTRYAEGGRATEASIFGEAGAEWAIPEEHTNRTAELLNEARVASGFSWSDLLQRTGGLNADTNREPTTIVYSPTINAGDANGVEEILRDDKERLSKWWKRMNARERMVTFA